MCIETKYIYLKSHSLFGELDEAKLIELSSLVKTYTVCRDESVIYGDGDYSKIYFVVKGKIKIAEANEMGEELIKDILTEGDFFGDLSLRGNPPIDEYAEALTANTIVCSFKVADFRKVLQHNPMIALNYANTVSSKLRKLEDRHADLVFRDAKARLIRFIKNWARMDGNLVGNKIVLNNYLTHSDIAGFISTSRQSVNVLFNE
ncbi:MAG TPA: Crp/Fnr family transcriptional regulator, partial [Chitinophagaceae bacterium]|nr:Crp/Fnr family transcriptional regulator [Chitinophagaceae bacterium]